MRGKFNQLDLLKELYSADSRETALIEMSQLHVKNISYLRTLVRFSDLHPDKKAEIRDNLSESLKWFSQLLWKISRYNTKYQKHLLSDFTHYNSENLNLFVTDPKPLEQLKESMLIQDTKLNGMFLAFKTVTKGYEPTVKKILDYYRLASQQIINGKID